MTTYFEGKKEDGYGLGIATVASSVDEFQNNFFEIKGRLVEWKRAREDKCMYVSFTCLCHESIHQDIYDFLHKVYYSERDLSPILKSLEANVILSNSSGTVCRKVPLGEREEDAPVSSRRRWRFW